jgi:hypothetical protein
VKEGLTAMLALRYGKEQLFVGMMGREGTIIFRSPDVLRKGKAHPLKTSYLLIVIYA